MWPGWKGAIIYHRGGELWHTYRLYDTLNTNGFDLEGSESYTFLPITYEEAGNDRN
jgi:hypothetical protein